MSIKFMIKAVYLIIRFSTVSKLSRVWTESECVQGHSTITSTMPGYPPNHLSDRPNQVAAYQHAPAHAAASLQVSRFGRLCVEACPVATGV